MDSGTIDIVPYVKHFAILVAVVFGSSWLASILARAALRQKGGKVIRGARSNAETLITTGTAIVSAYLGFKILF